MPDRIVKVVLRGDVGGLKASMAEASAAVRQTADEMTGASKESADFRDGLQEVGNTAGKVGLVAAAGLGAIVAATANFDQAMSSVQAATHETTANMKSLREAAIDAGAKTAFSASEAAEGIEALAKAGVSTKDILAGGLTGALNLAASDGIAVGDAAEFAASAMTQFGLKGAQVSHIADLLAAAAGKAQGSVTDVAFALKYAGVPAASLGVSIEETVGTIGYLAKAGIVGEQAGTSLRQVLYSLAAPTSAAKKEMAQYGLELYNSKGKFVGIQGAAEQLKTRLGGVSDAQRNAALSTIFGANAISAAIQLYNGGGKAIGEWTNKVNDAGYAAQTAALRLDNLKGDMEQLGGSIETFLIGAGEGAQGPLRGIVQEATSVVNALNEIPGPAKNVGVALLGITAVAGGSVFLGAVVVGRIAETRLALDALGASAVRARAALSGLGLAAGTAAALAAIGVGLHQLEKDDATPALRKYADAFGELGTSSEGANKKIEKLFDVQGTKAALIFGKINEIDGIQDAFEKLNQSKATQFGTFASNGFGIFDTPADLATEAVKKADAALAGLVSSGNITAATNSYDLLAEKARKAGLSEDELNELLPAYSAAAKQAAESTAKVSTETVQLAAATGLTVEQIAELTKQMQDNVKATLGAFDAETKYRQALVEAQEQAKKSNAGIKGSSKEALANRDALSGLAAAWNGQSDAVKANQGRYKAARKAFIETATAMGVPITAARRLARTLLELPPSKQIDISVQTGQATSTITTLQGLLGGLKDKTLHVNVVGNKDSFYDPTTILNPKPPKKKRKKKADGGLVTGPGGPRDDMIPAWLSNEEFVMPADAVAFYGLDMLESMRRKRFAFAKGGAVSGVGAYVRDTLDLKYPSTLKQWNAALAASTKVVEREKDQRADLISKRDAVSSAVQDKLKSDLFGKDNGSSVWMSDADRAKAGTGDVLSTLTGDIANINATRNALLGLKNKGLDGAAYDELASKGNLQEIQGFAGLTKAQIAQYEKLFNQRQAAATTVGNFAGSAAYGKQIVAQSKELKHIAALNSALNRQVAALRKESAKHQKELRDSIKNAGPRRPRKP